MFAIRDLHGMDSMYRALINQFSYYRPNEPKRDGEKSIRTQANRMPCQLIDNDNNF